MSHSFNLQQVYAASSPQQLASAYAGWAASYDRETAADGYCLPFMVCSWLARHVRPGAGALLDAGCGTGLSGPYLRALGYEVEGLDFSPEMLRIAETRQAYARLTRATLGEALPWQSGHFRAVFSTGVFTAGHAPASSLDEIARITAAGGHVVVTVRDSVLETAGFRRKFEALTTARIWRPVEESPPFRAFVIAEPDVLVQAFVFEIN